MEIHHGHNGGVVWIIAALIVLIVVGVKLATSLISKYICTRSTTTSEAVNNCLTSLSRFCRCFGVRRKLRIHPAASAETQYDHARYYSTSEPSDGGGMIPRQCWRASVTSTMLNEIPQHQLAMLLQQYGIDYARLEKRSEGNDDHAVIDENNNSNTDQNDNYPGHDNIDHSENNNAESNFEHHYYINNNNSNNNNSSSSSNNNNNNSNNNNNNSNNNNNNNNNHNNHNNNNNKNNHRNFSRSSSSKNNSGRYSHTKTINNDANNTYSKGCHIIETEDDLYLNTTITANPNILTVPRASPQDPDHKRTHINKYSAYTSSIAIDLQLCSSPALTESRALPSTNYLIGAGMIRNSGNSPSGGRRYADDDSRAVFTISNRKHIGSRGYISMHHQLFNFKL